MRDAVHILVRDARTVLRPKTGEIDIAELDRTFTIRASEGFVEMFCSPLVTAIALAAPRVRLRFAPKPEKNAEPLREGQIDLEVGVMGGAAPEMRTRLIFRDRFVGAARSGHPLLSDVITPESYAACRHVVASRRGAFTGPVDAALAELGLVRETMVVVPGFSDALQIAMQSDLIALVPGSGLRSGGKGLDGISTFSLPVPTPEIVVSAIWHPRMDADPAHRWLRETMIAACRNTVGDSYIGLRSEGTLPCRP